MGTTAKIQGRDGLRLALEDTSTAPGTVTSGLSEAPEINWALCKRRSMRVEYCASCATSAPPRC